MLKTPITIKTILLTLLALVAFAANSVLCRLALGDGNIDAVSFTVLRLLSGIIMLMLILNLKIYPNSNSNPNFNSNKGSKQQTSAKGSWFSAVMLFLYAITFSFAYVSLDTGTGALILFGTVQITIIVISLFSGTKLHISEWLGLLTAFSGFIYLIIPNVSTPSISGFILMSISGIAWGVYTIRGRSSLNPLRDTAFNFTRTTPLLFGLAIVAFNFMPNIQISNDGIILAILSGAIASGIGYTIWYSALKGLSATEAAIVQLLVPVIAAIGGVIFVSEIITDRLVYSGIMILGGILIVVLGKLYCVGQATKIQ